MKKLVSVVLCSTLFFGACSKPQVVIKHAPLSERRMRVAILPFKDAPGAPGSGERAAEAMMTYLLNIPDYDLIERSALESVLKEQNLGLTGAVEPSKAAELGKLLGADAIVVGSVTQYQTRRMMILPPAKATVTARLVRTESGTVDWSGTYALGWHPAKWVFSFFWPLAVIFVMTSPTAEDRLNKAVKGIAENVSKKNQLAQNIN